MKEGDEKEAEGFQHKEGLGGDTEEGTSKRCGRHRVEMCEEAV